MMEGDLHEKEVIEIDDDDEQPTITSQPEIIDVDAETTTTSQQQAQDKSKPISEEDIERRKRRRMIRRMRKPGATPSFVALVTPNLTEEDHAPKRIRIDVDEYLGLKKKKPAASSIVSQTSATLASAALPSDDGWFEGVVPLALPGEESFLPEMQVLIRSNLELFSATDADTNTSQAGRRTPTVRGKVGIRCIHCAEAIKENPSLPWPGASISYPVNIVGLYPVCSQKPQLHFHNCSNLPPSIKAHMHQLMFDEDGSPRRQRKAVASDGDAAKSVSTIMYYTIAAKMIGLVDVPGGMRFGRDLALDPLPMETVRAQIEETQLPYKRTGGSAQGDRPDPVPSSEARITADDESERVLAQAVAEKDDEKLLARSDDKKLVTDFIFLCVKQMAICHAVQSDFSTRGKKTKMMRKGFAGFCCRHCSRFNADDDMVLNVDYSCRSFASAADNLVSAISNSFYVHIQKCPLTPSSVRHALAAYKKIHSKQMTRLQHGSQRRLFLMLWTRLRAADLSAEEMEEKLKHMPPQPERILSSPFASYGAVGASAGGSSNASVPDDVTSVSATSYTGDPAVGQRVPMPVCSDEETRKVLEKAEENHDPSVNDNLMLPSDRHLISDFVFLMMRQLKAANPNLNDFSRGKRSTVLNTSQAGLQCIHCINKPQDHFFSAVGRSFPSAPDNMASTLNSSLYNHSQKCPFTPEETKRALANLKKIHSTQCSSLRFGSQRRFFNTVFNRLRMVKLDQVDLPVVGENGETAQPPQSSSAADEANSDVLLECGFLETRDDCYECQLCRMVPYALRAQDSVAIGRPSLEYVRGHEKCCKKNSFDLGNAANALKTAVAKYPALSGEGVMHSPSFTKVVREAVAGNDDLTMVFTGGVAQAMMGDRKAADGDPQDGSNEWKGLWGEFPSRVDTGAVFTAFKEFAVTVPDLEPDLAKERRFLRFFQIISPALVVVRKPINVSAENEPT
jgi:hypothetical protein